LLAGVLGESFFTAAGCALTRPNPEVTPQVTPQVKKVLTVRKFESVQIEPNFFERPRPTGANGHEVALTLDIFRRKLVR
jgi:hypothetical protein